MPPKHWRNWSAKDARSHKPYMSTNLKRQNGSSTTVSSSPGFETPDNRRLRKARTSSLSHSASASLTSNDPFSDPVLPTLPSQPRISLSFPSSADNSSSPAHTLMIEQNKVFEGESDVEQRENADALNEIVMAIDRRDRGTVGCAYYVAREEKLYMMEDMKAAGIDIVDTLKIHAQPTILLISTRADEAFEEHLSKESRSSSDGGDTNPMFGSYVLNSRPSQEFQFESAKNKLINLELFDNHESRLALITPDDELSGDLHNTNQSTGRQGRMMVLAGQVDMESRITIGCAGAVLSYLQRRRTAEFLPGDEAGFVAFRVRSIDMFTLDDMMFINADTLLSLQILQLESHPNIQMQGPTKAASGAKESLSLYGLFHLLAHTSQGKQKLRQIFLKPSSDMAFIKERQNTIACFLKPDNSTALETISKSLKGIKNLRTVIIHLQKGINNPSRRASPIQYGVWGTLQQFVYNVLKVAEAVRDLMGAQNLLLINRIIQTLSPLELKHIGQIITETIDFPNSASQHRAAVAQGVDAELDNIKRTYDGMDDLLTKVAQRLTSEVPGWAQNYIENCIFFPQLGFLTVVPVDPESGRGLYEGEGMDHDVWHRMFCSENMGYYKNGRMKEMDNYFGDMYGMICDKEIEIIHALAVRVLEHENLLIAASDICGELDSVLALALGARKYNFIAPHVTTENIIQIEGGRHPLQELTVPSFVSNDTFIRGGLRDNENVSTHSSETLTEDLNSATLKGPSFLMMTGPNYSGKSVYLKQVALIVYLAHLGSWVPAMSATIGLTDKILTRVATRESVSRTQSAFMIDLQQVSLAITQATRRSLILIDEFGKGTDSTGGAGLAAGVISYFLSLSEDARPKLLFATHFHELFANHYLPSPEENPDLDYAHMQVRLSPESIEPEDQVVYLYNYMSGLSLAALAHCALL